MADPYGNYLSNQGLLSGPALNPKGIDPELLRQITGLLSQPGPAVGLGFPAGLEGAKGLAETTQTASDLGRYAVEGGGLSQDQLIGKSFDAASALAAGGVPMAETGAAGVFGGKLAKTANLDAMKQAEGLAAKGADREEIWNQTGWFQGKDGQWRFEIPDYGVNVGSKFADRLTGGNPAGVEGSASGRVAYALPHPELYAAYPELRNINVLSKYDAGAAQPYRGSYTPALTGSDPMIRADANSLYGPNGVQGVMLHELQHAIQEKEGFNPGSSPGSIELAPGMSPENAEAWRYYQYRHNAGETEARNVQSRMKMRPDELRDVPPWYTEDIPYDRQWLTKPGILGQR